MRTIVAEWEPPSIIPYAALDPVCPGALFVDSLPDPNIDHYEVDRYDQDELEWLSVGNPRTPRVEFPAEHFENATVRIRAVLRDGTKTPFITSGNFLVFSMVADFESLNNIILLSFI
ncbi:MAG: hypothetical protein CL699_07570 [Chloroflexi bacterium]|jgi:hypothetical protein|nr:hypothetical protein [Chloroflexota bacterium]|tara:strand:- start:1797 stop:2147 length:351 start_codon:yes stop_codon:yes gene_type:complete